MLLRRLRLKNFRGYDDHCLEFNDGVNLIAGPNACGKTSILEAVHYLTTARSFRTSHTTELIRHGAEYAYLELTFVKHGIDQILKIAFDAKRRRFTHNSTEFQSTSHLLGIIHATVFSPDHAALVKGAPQVRRQYLDLQLVQVDPLYVHYLSRYYRAMRHRNVQLKSKDFATIALWETEMARAAGYLIYRRIEAIEELAKMARNRYRALTGADEELSLEYKSSAAQLNSEQAIMEYHQERFLRLRGRESEIGTTLTGPHKDDLMITINGKEARHYASEGQQRSVVAALKLSEWERMKQQIGINPIMLVDDIGMGLDKRRKEHFLNHLSNFQQVILTATDEQLNLPNVNLLRTSCQTASR
ncbi:MAG: DNA replication/repair protein RecF [Chlamydiales bacterium]|nr:DNA replication/repair protein RecF [Chlamydiia bacterium]MCP5508116.1 DNA replication/repair protein RecF [Chlamydiales bacterium]